jgi:polyhydroxyalkanoate synthase subunit PhaC
MVDMSPISDAEFKLADPVQFARNMSKVFEQASSIAKIVADRPDLAKKDAEMQVTPTEQVAKTLGAVAQSYMNDPQRLMDAQMKLWQSYTMLWQNAWRRAVGEEVKPVIEPKSSDKRFKDKDWHRNAVFDFLKQFYLVSTNWANDLVKNAEGIDDHTRLKARFYVEQISRPRTSPSPIRKSCAPRFPRTARISSKA